MRLRRLQVLLLWHADPRQLHVLYCSSVCCASCRVGTLRAAGGGKLQATEIVCTPQTNIA